MSLMPCSNTSLEREYYLTRRDAPEVTYDDISLLVRDHYTNLYAKDCLEPVVEGIYGTPKEKEFVELVNRYFGMYLEEEMKAASGKEVEQQLGRLVLMSIRNYLEPMVTK